MVDVAPFGVMALLAPFIGLLLLVGGLYARRHHMVRRKTAGVLLATVTAILGVATMTVGIWRIL